MLFLVCCFMFFSEKTLTLHPYSMNFRERREAQAVRHSSKLPVAIQNHLKHQYSYI